MRTMLGSAKKRFRSPLSMLSPCKAAVNSSGVDNPRIDIAGHCTSLMVSIVAQAGADRVVKML